MQRVCAIRCWPRCGCNGWKVMVVSHCHAVASAKTRDHAAQEIETLDVRCTVSAKQNITFKNAPIGLAPGNPHLIDGFGLSFVSCASSKVQPNTSHDTRCCLTCSLCPFMWTINDSWSIDGSQRTNISSSLFELRMFLLSRHISMVRA